MLFLPALAFGCLGIYLLIWWRRKLSIAADARRWPIVNGRVVISQISQGDANTQDSLQFSYVYEFAGIERTSFEIDLFELSSRLTSDEMKSYTQKYPEGSSILVYCNPHTGAGVVEPDNTVGAFRTRNMGLFLLVVGGFFAATAVVF